MIEVSDWAFFIKAFVALLTIVNPFSTASVFLTITTGDSKKKKWMMARKATIIAAFTLIIFALIGQYILNFFSITIDAFRIAGGILIAGVGIRMIKGTRLRFASEKDKKEAAKRSDISIIPLGIPLLAGPGSMTTSIALMGDAGSIIKISSVIVSIILVCIVSYYVLKKSDYVDKVLGETGMKVVDRVLGLIVMVVGVQFIINGIQGAITSWGLF
jgi:multiple antibiotic resistance protein